LTVEGPKVEKTVISKKDEKTLETEVLNLKGD